MQLFSLLLVGSIAWAQGVSPDRPTPRPEFPRRIILDTDPGIDDAMAILLALRSPELKVEAITVVAGNVPVDLGAENARKLAELAGRTDVIVAKGAARPFAAAVDHRRSDSRPKRPGRCGPALASNAARPPSCGAGDP